MIVIQKKMVRNVVGLANAFSAAGKEIHLWDIAEEDLNDLKNVEMVILVEMDGTVGYKTINSIPKTTPLVLLDIKEVPKVCKEKKNLSLIQVPLCSDSVFFSQGFYNRKYACDIAYFSNVPVDDKPYILQTLGKLSSKDYRMRFFGDVSLKLVPYMGRVDHHEVISIMKSAKLCIDFDFNSAVDLVYHGCNVISNLENEIVPSFNDNNFLEVVEREIAKPRPIIDDRKDRFNIRTFYEFLPRLLELL